MHEKVVRFFKNQNILTPRFSRVDRLKTEIPCPYGVSASSSGVGNPTAHKKLRQIEQQYECITTHNPSYLDSRLESTSGRGRKLNILSILI